MVEEPVWLSMRHFLTREYLNEIYMGQQQYPICNTDIKTNNLLELLECCTIFASPLRRSQQTVDYLISVFTYVDFNVVYLDELKERCLGDFEGKSKKLIRSNHDYFVDGKFIVTKTPPNGESFLDFRIRVERAVNRISATAGNILVISHLQTLRMIRFCMLKSYDYSIWHDINYTHGEVVLENYRKR